MPNKKNKLVEILDSDELSTSYQIEETDLNEFKLIEKKKKKEKRQKINNIFVNIDNTNVHFERDDEYIDKWSYNFLRFNDRVEQIINREWTIIPEIDEHFKPYVVNNFKMPISKRKNIWKVKNDDQYKKGIEESIKCKNPYDYQPLLDCGWTCLVDTNII